MGLEAKIENKVNNWAREQYGDAFKDPRGRILIRKMNGMGTRSWPDRLYIGERRTRDTSQIPTMFFIEWKAPDGDLSDLQRQMVAALRRIGITTYVCDNPREGQEIIRFQMGDGPRTEAVVRCATRGEVRTLTTPKRRGIACARGLPKRPLSEHDKKLIDDFAETLSKKQRRMLQKASHEEGSS